MADNQTIDGEGPFAPARAGTLPVARGGTGSTSLDNVTVGNALKLGSVIASRFSQYHTITGDMLAYIDSQPEASTGMFASTSSATNVPPGLANGGGMGFFVKLKQYDARIFFVSHYGPNYKSYTIFKVREEWSEWHSL